VSGTHFSFLLQYVFVGSWFYIEQVPVQDAKLYFECAFWNLGLHYLVGGYPSLMFP